ncbi:MULTISPECIES: helix-turn-helix domain-containing protein [Mycetocola]|uniref:XRE family transcriptional regulator n=1 Tax=Mycetocola lacteus TaxID=76637 RepID=A0A3L7AGK6_9MICO|nr:MULTISPECIES: helix-turn-helix transcriptional regulator [Mycetocola]MCS4276440.1 transcriptional regulator with XRE-family HTH domain [Mycetocola sp. BIGb0189]RLP79297.1 XRE family transcriptional regulator [Mycetocola lacteus]
MEHFAETPTWSQYANLLGSSLRHLRLGRGLSQEQVAMAAGISRYTYQKFEKGESRPGTSANPSLQNVLALSQVFGVPIEELLPSTPPDLSDR